MGDRCLVAPRAPLPAQRQLHRQKLHGDGGPDLEGHAHEPSHGEYAEALENYEEALKLEDDPNDKAFILYNMALVFTSNGDHEKAMELYNEALDLNSHMPQVFNNMAVIHHHLGSIAEEQGDQDEADRRFDLAADFWTKAIRLAPNNYIEAQNWLKTTGRGTVDVYF